LDALAVCLVHQAGADEEEIKSAAAAPFLYSRISARIKQGERPDANWTLIFAAARRAITVMVFITIVAAAFFLRDASRRPNPIAVSNVESLAPDLVGATRVVQGCLLSNISECSITTEDVLSTIVKQDEIGVTR